MAEEAKPFWEVKTLEEMSPEEWDMLCDGCGRCCLIKLEDEDTDEVYTTRLACSLLDVGSCRCRDYKNRHKVMHDCLTIDPESLKALDWLPASCAYRRLAAEGFRPDILHANIYESGVPAVIIGRQIGAPVVVR